MLPSQMQRVHKQEGDLLIVVGMFLTGFDAPTLNTLFGDKNTKNIVLEKSYHEYMQGFTDVLTGKANRGYVEVVKDLETHFPEPDAIETEKAKKHFVKVFGEYLRVENILQNCDEFMALQALQTVDLNDDAAVTAFQQKYFISNEDLAAMQAVTVLPTRAIQDYKSTYNDIRDWLRQQRTGNAPEQTQVDWNDVVFEVTLLDSQEINLDYILALNLYENKKNKDKASLIDEVRRLIRGSLGHRAKEHLIVDFINQSDLDCFEDKASIIEAFFNYAQVEQKREANALIAKKPKQRGARRYLTTSLRREYASEQGTALNELLPKMSPLNPQYLTKKQSVLDKIKGFVEKFKGVGGVL